MMDVSLALVLKGLAGAALGSIILFNLPTRFWHPAERATLQYLANTVLETLDVPSKSFKASDLWKSTGAVIMVIRRPGCLLCREEAKALSTLKPRLDEANVRLYGVVHENYGIKGIQPFFEGEIFLDKERHFYGPRERWMGLTGFLRLGVWTSYFRARGKNFDGNLKGEGRLLGGLFVVGPGDQGVIFEHRESEFGDHASLTDIMDAVERMKRAKL